GAKCRGLLLELLLVFHYVAILTYESCDISLKLWGVCSVAENQSQMANIPKVIHQTWRDNDVPEHFDILSATWKENHVNWKYVLWTDKMNRDFIEDRYPEFI